MAKHKHKKADFHPHFAGHRTGGHDVAAKHHANTSPAPGQSEFSAQEEAAMRGANAAQQQPMPTAAGAPMPSDDDGDEGMV